MYMQDDLKNYKYCVGAEGEFLILSNKSEVIADYDEPVDLKLLYKSLDHTDLYFYVYKRYYNDAFFTDISSTYNDSVLEIPEFFTASCYAFGFLLVLICIFNVVTACVCKGGIFRA